VLIGQHGITGDEAYRRLRRHSCETSLTPWRLPATSLTQPDRKVTMTDRRDNHLDPAPSTAKRTAAQPRRRGDRGRPPGGSVPAQLNSPRDPHIGPHLSKAVAVAGSELLDRAEPSRGARDAERDPFR